MAFEVRSDHPLPIGMHEILDENGDTVATVFEFEDDGLSPHLVLLSHGWIHADGPEHVQERRAEAEEAVSDLCESFPNTGRIHYEVSRTTDHD